MSFGSHLTTAQVLELFTEVITTYDGEVADTFHSNDRLFTRSILPDVEEVRPKDRLQGGVALKATSKDIWIYPFVFRQVCKNGAILAETIASQHIADIDHQHPETVRETVREGIEACCCTELFQDNVERMRSAATGHVNLMLTMLPLLRQLPSELEEDFSSKIISQFFQERDSTRFGLANAVTAVARDVQDPTVRWNLEEFGGGIAIGLTPKYPVDSGHAARDLSETTVAVIR